MSEVEHITKDEYDRGKLDRVPPSQLAAQLGREPNKLYNMRYIYPALEASGHYAVEDLVEIIYVKEGLKVCHVEIKSLDVPAPNQASNLVYPVTVDGFIFIELLKKKRWFRKPLMEPVERGYFLGTEGDWDRDLAELTSEPLSSPTK